MWSMLYCTKPFSGLPSHPNSADNIRISAITAMHSNKVLKSLQILCFWRSSLYIATVNLVFISDIKTVHFFCASKLKPVLGYSLKPIWTNRLRPMFLRCSFELSSFLWWFDIVACMTRRPSGPKSPCHLSSKVHGRSKWRRKQEGE